MHHRKAHGLAALLLSSILLLGGCKAETSFILPPETTAPTVTVTEPTETLQSHAHSYRKETVAPTCTKEGYTQHTCACGDSYTDSHTAPLGHDYAVTTVAPTTSKRGYDLHQCTRCGDSFKDSYVDKLPAHTEPPETEPPVTTQSVYNISSHVIGTLEYEILAEINARRASEGLGSLKMDKKLCALAAIRAYETSVSFSHTRLDGRSWSTVLDDYGYNGTVPAENLLNCTTGYSASKLVDVWMKYANQRNNILTPSFTKAGLGIFYANGTIYIVNLFAE